MFDSFFNFLKRLTLSFNTFLILFFRMSQKSIEKLVQDSGIEFTNLVQEVYGIQSEELMDIWSVFKDSLVTNIMKEIKKEEQIKASKSIPKSVSKAEWGFKEIKKEEQIIIPKSIPNQAPKAELGFKVQSSKIEKKPKVSTQELQMEAERLRCAEVRSACDRGAVIVGDPYYDASNPRWMQMAKSNLLGDTDSFMDGIDAPSTTRYVVTQDNVDHVSNYINELGSMSSQMRDRNYKEAQKYIKAQIRVNAKQDYRRFGGK